MIVRKDNLPFISRNVDCYLCVFSDKPIKNNSSYILKHTNREVTAHVEKILYEIDVNTLHRMNINHLQKNSRISESEIFADNKQLKILLI